MNVIDYRFVIDELTGRLTINDVKRSDAGDISCLVENSAGKISKVVNLHVKYQFLYQYR